MKTVKKFDPFNLFPKMPLIAEFGLDNDIFSLVLGDSSSGKANVIKTKSGYDVQVELPGFKKEMVDISIDNDVLNISAKIESSDKEEKSSYLRKEFKTSSVKRSFNIPSDLDKENIKAKFEDGILTVSLTNLKKEEKPQGKKITID